MQQDGDGVEGLVLCEVQRRVPHHIIHGVPPQRGHPMLVDLSPSHRPLHARHTVVYQQLPTFPDEPFKEVKRIVNFEE